jgi:lysophospholipase L1-like esterase
MSGKLLPNVSAPFPSFCPLALSIAEAQSSKTPLPVGILGGSISAGHGVKHNETYPQCVRRLLAEDLALELAVANAARGATSLNLAAYCIAQMLKPSTRVLVLEYSVNGGSLSDAEAVVRAAGPERAVVLLSVNRGTPPWELDAHAKLGIPLIRLQGVRRPFHDHSDGHHLNAAGHALAAQGLVALFTHAWHHRHQCQRRHDLQQQEGTRTTSNPSTTSRVGWYGVPVPLPGVSEGSTCSRHQCLSSFGGDALGGGCFERVVRPDGPWAYRTLRSTYGANKHLWSTGGAANASTLGASLTVPLPSLSTDSHGLRMVALGVLNSNGIGDDPSTHTLGTVAVYVLHSEGGKRAASLSSTSTSGAPLSWPWRRPHADRRRMVFATNCTGSRKASPVWTIQIFCQLPEPLPPSATALRIELAAPIFDWAGYNFGVTGLFVRPSG